MDYGSKLLNIIRLRKSLCWQRMSSNGEGIELVPTNLKQNELLLEEEERLQRIISRKNKKLLNLSK